QLDSQPDQVSPADPLEHQQGTRSGFQQGAEAEHGQGDQQAETEYAAADGGQRQPCAIEPAVGQCQQAVGAGGQCQAKGGDEIDQPEVERHAGISAQEGASLASTP